MVKRAVAYPPALPAPEVELGGEGIVGAVAKGEVVGAVGAAASVGLHVMQFEQAGVAAAVSWRRTALTIARRRRPREVAGAGSVEAPGGAFGAAALALAPVSAHLRVAFG